MTDYANQAAVPYTTSGNTVTFNVQDGPIGLLTVPKSSATAPSITCN